PPRVRPVGSHRAIPVVNFDYQIPHWLPAQVNCSLGSNVQIDSRNKQVPSWTNQLSDISQAFFGIDSGHMTKKIARDHHVLRPENPHKFRVSYIPNLPRDSLFEPRFDFGPIAFPIEHFNHLSLGQSFKNRSTDQFGSI